MTKEKLLELVLSDELEIEDEQVRDFVFIFECCHFPSIYLYSIFVCLLNKSWAGRGCDVSS